MSQAIVCKIPDKVYEYVIEFIKYYKEKPFTPFPKPLRTTKIEDFIDDPFYTKFVSQDFATIETYFEHAKYLGYHPLVELSAATIASKMINKSIEEIREMFGGVNDIPEEEYKAIQDTIKAIKDIQTDK